MNDESREPTAPTSPATSTDPAPPPPPPTDSDRLSGPLRALAIVGAIVMAFAAAVVIAVMVDLGSSPICDDVRGPLGPTEDCYDISSTAKPISLVLGWAGGVLGVVAALALLRVTFTGRGGRLALQLVGGAVVLAALSLIIG